MIILEGTDCVGKTTLATKLCEAIASRLGTKDPMSYYGHMGKPKPSFDHLAEYMSNVRCGVQDRYHLGSIVYGYILGGGTYLSARKMRVVQSYLSWVGCHTIIITCSRDSLRERLGKQIRGELYRTDQILDAGDAYRGLAESKNNGTRYCDQIIDVTNGWPGDEDVESIVNAWFRKFMV